MPALADMFGAHANANPRTDLITRNRGCHEIFTRQVLAGFCYGKHGGQHHCADMKNGSAVDIVKFETLHLGAVYQCGMRRGNPIPCPPRPYRTGFRPADSVSLEGFDSMED
jgi:hypothetical protein